MNAKMNFLACTICLMAGILSVQAFTIAVEAPQVKACKTATVDRKESGDFLPGKTVSLAATANSGWAFAGWYKAYDEVTETFSNKVSLVGNADWRTETASYVVGTSDETLYARFVEPKDDGLVFDFAEIFGTDCTDLSWGLGTGISPTNVYSQVVDVESRSFPKLTVSGLPSGLKFDAKTMELTGTPSAPGAYAVSVTGKNVSGFTYRQDFDLLVDNVVSEHVSGINHEDDLIVNEPLVFDWYLSDLFEIVNTNAEFVSAKITGLPVGLSCSYDAEWDEYLIFGTPTKTGVYTVWATISFSDGTHEQATSLVAVNGLDPFEHGVDFSGLQGHVAGDCLTLDDEVCLGTYDAANGEGVTSVTLPSGLTAFPVTDEGGMSVSYYAIGTFSSAGRFSCRATVAEEDWDTEKKISVTLSQDVIVSAAPGVYLSVGVDEAETHVGCRASGGGVFVPGVTAKLTASAGRGFVFAGWYDGSGMPLAAVGSDYRKSPLEYAVSSGGDNEVLARFVSTEEDYVEIQDLDGRAYVLDPNDSAGFRESFAIDSPSYPTLTFKNLPTGVTCEADPDVVGDYVLAYDPLASSKTPTPGKYHVTATAVNVTRASDVAEFLLTVSNVTSAHIRVRDDYGVLTPSVPMTPISLADAVDFARGDTLNVSGLPAGLKYVAADQEITGTPTKPGEYTLTFTASVKLETGTVTATATAFITVKPFPELAVTFEGEAAAEAFVAGCKVTGAGNYKAGTKATLRATAAKGWVFAGWSGVDGLSEVETLTPTLAYVMGTNDLTEVGATFIETRDDMLSVGDIWELGDASVSNTLVVVKGGSVSTNLIACLLETRSLPTVTVSGLPSGLTFDKKTLLIKGKATKSGVFYATVSAKNAGGYVFTRILRVAVKDDDDDPIPEDVALKNEADIDFRALSDLRTGDRYMEYDGVGFDVPVDSDGVSVKSVAVSGQPAGLKVTATVDGETGTAEVILTGTPTKVGRFTVKVSVTYADNGRATSEWAFIISDGGCRWLDVLSLDETLGTVSGSGVYSAGATVKISAKAKSQYVFGGWYEDGGSVVFENLALMDGVDYRTASASFVFRPDMFLLPTAPALWADFGSKLADAEPDISFDETEGWTIDPALSSETAFSIDSFSLPKVTVTGAPKGVTVDAVRGTISYDATKAASVVPGWYTLTVKAANQSGRSSVAALRVFVANKTSERIGGLSPEADAYVLMVGVAMPEGLVEPEAADGLTLSAAGLPAGLKLVKETDPLSHETDYRVEGVPSKAGTNTVTFTASGKIDGVQVKEVATITISVVALPQWSQGTFNGVYRTVSEDGSMTNDSGTVSLTVSAGGKVSGKILAGGKSHSLSAASLASFDPAAGVVSASVDVAWATLYAETFVVDFAVNGDGLGVAFVYGLGGCGTELVQNAWLRKDLAAPAFATGAKQPVLTDGGLVCKFGAKGAVTLSGSVEGVRAGGTAQTLLGCSDLTECANARLPVYLTGKSFESGSYCKVYDVRLTDSDGDGKIDSVEWIAPEK